MTERRALLLVTAAYVWWGCSAIFWRALDSVAPIDQLSFRVALGLLYLAAYAIIVRRNPLTGLTAAHWKYGALAAALIALNWGVFLWAVANDQAVEAALGYFLMPLFAVALGVFALGERLTADQKIAFGLAAVGMVWTFAVVGSSPWVSLALGMSFAVYGWARKVGPWNAVDGLTFEMAIVAPVLLVVLGARTMDGVDVVGDGAVLTITLILATGAVTVIPLLLFAAATKRASLTAVGLLQYINPTLQFLVGWQLFGESVSSGRLLGFAWIWAALAFVVRSELRSNAEGSQRPVDGFESGGTERIVRS